MKATGKIFLVSLLIFLASLAFAAGAQAQAGDYPIPTELYVNDFAGVLTSSDAASIRQIFGELKSQTGIVAVVVTVNSIRDYATGDTTIESFATHLFNRWGIGDEQKNDGMLILVAIRDHEVQITPGSGYAGRMDAAMQQVIDQDMIPAFKVEDYSRGIAAGARSVAQKLGARLSLGEQVTQSVSWFGGFLGHLSFGTIVLWIASIAYFSAGVSFAFKGKIGWGWVLLSVTGMVLLGIGKVLLAILESLDSSGGSGGGYHRSSSRRSFGGVSSSGGSRPSGGGRTFGGGAHGKW